MRNTSSRERVRDGSCERREGRRQSRVMDEIRSDGTSVFDSMVAVVVVYSIPLVAIYAIETIFTTVCKKSG